MGWVLLWGFSGCFLTYDDLCEVDPLCGDSGWLGEDSCVMSQGYADRSCETCVDLPCDEAGEAGTSRAGSCVENGYTHIEWFDHEMLMVDPDACEDGEGVE